jgi:hypothetical protein
MNADSFYQLYQELSVERKLPRVNLDNLAFALALKVAIHESFPTAEFVMGTSVNESVLSVSTNHAHWLRLTWARQLSTPGDMTSTGYEEVMEALQQSILLPPENWPTHPISWVNRTLDGSVTSG